MPDDTYAPTLKQREEWEEIARRLKAFIRKHAPGGCFRLSVRDHCTCPLCDVDRLRTHFPEEPEEDRADLGALYGLTKRDARSDPTYHLVAGFATALLTKLRDAERKYGYTTEWRDSPNLEGMKRELLQHVGKGDPRDVAAYCAFLWYHGESTALASPEEPTCDGCGTEVWYNAWVPDDVWERIRPDPEAPEGGGGTLCVRCMDRRCADAGLPESGVQILYIGESLSTVPVERSPEEPCDHDWEFIGEHANSEGVNGVCRKCGARHHDSPEEPVEHWREHPTEPGLYMSTNGRGVRGGEEVYQTENEKGYLRITCSDGTPRGVGVLVLETFVGPRPDGHDCDHVNRDRRDNRLTNLRWLPVEENRAVRGKRNAAAKLTPTDVREIRQRYKGPESQYDLAAAFEVDQRTISMIVRGETWAHVESPIGQPLEGEPSDG